MKVGFTERAQGDLRSITISIASHNEDAAFRIAALIKEKALSLAEHPERGRVLGADPRVRRLLAGKFVIIYSVASTMVSILRVVHGARDIQALLHDDPESGPTDT